MNPGTQQAQNNKRFGVIFARIGTSHMHTIGVPLPIDPPSYPTTTGQLGANARTRIAATSPKYRFENRPGLGGVPMPVAVEALPGAHVQLEVQDISRLSPEDASKMTWTCKHPDCGGGTLRASSKDELIRMHGKQKDLIEEAQKSPVGQPHLCYGVVEIAGCAEKRDEKGRVVTPATPATVMLATDVE